MNNLYGKSYLKKQRYQFNRYNLIPRPNFYYYWFLIVNYVNIDLFHCSFKFWMYRTNKWETTIIFDVINLKFFKVNL